jgi:hypothetical protein
MKPHIYKIVLTMIAEYRDAKGERVLIIDIIQVDIML